MPELNVYWGEAHDNTYQFAESPTPIDEVYRRAASHLDFYAAAYYTAFSKASRVGGHLSETDKPHRVSLETLETWKEPERLDREWAEVQDTSRRMNQPGRFVTFPGYEWQGDGSPGDHNVFAREEGLPIFRVQTLAELYACLRQHEAIAIPHHTAYHPGQRGRDWSVFDERLSPFAEVYSIHGCSETDEEWVGIRQNSHMGPGEAGGTYQAALDRGYHLGAICSTDNWGDMPGHYGNGRMACLAPELTRQSLWEAFRARRVYGVTGDRIRLDFRLDGQPMGSILRSTGPRRIEVAALGSDAIDRIELLRNGRVIDTHCHQGTWEVPAAGVRTRFKLRVEVGWGPRPNELELPPQPWHGRLAAPGGTIVGWEPCWISSGQGPAVLTGETAIFDLLSSGATLKERSQNANVFEIEADASCPVELTLNGAVERASLAELAAGSRNVWYKEDCVRLLEERCDIPPGAPERNDIYWHLAHKAKIHRAIPEVGYSASLEVVDDEPLEAEANYRVRVEQRNGQRAWSSPIWVRPG